VASSKASKLAAKKNKVSKALKDVQSKTAEGSLQQLMMQHFRDTTNPMSFYSLPMSIANTLPMKQLSVAVTSMLSIKGKPAQPAGTLPLGDEIHTLPLENRTEQIEDEKPTFLEPLQDDVTEEMPKEGGEREEELDLKQLVGYCQLDGLLVFKLADKSPYLKERPLHSVDNLTFSDFAIRLYKVHKNVEDREIWISPTSNAEVPVVQFFAGKDPNRIIDQMRCWRIDQSSGDVDADEACFRVIPAGRAFQQRVACPLTLQAVDIKRNLKPTCFEMYVTLSSRGWTWRTWRGKPSDLKRLPISLDPNTDRKVFYGGSFYYLLCLVTLPAIAGKLKNKTCLMNGQLEVYYATAFALGQSSRFAELEQLQPNQPAQFYRSLTVLIEVYSLKYSVSRTYKIVIIWIHPTSSSRRRRRRPPLVPPLLLDGSLVLDPYSSFLMPASFLIMTTIT